MKTTQIAPYGSWKSPITSELITASAVGLDEIHVDGDDIFWSELRPNEGGRIVIIQQKPDGTLIERTPAPFNARTRVHEYGGGSYAVNKGAIYFSNFADQYSPIPLPLIHGEICRHKTPLFSSPAD